MTHVISYHIIRIPYHTHTNASQVYGKYKPVVDRECLGGCLEGSLIVDSECLGGCLEGVWGCLGNRGGSYFVHEGGGATTNSGG